MSLDALKAFFREVEDKPIQEHQKETKEPNKVILTAHIDRDNKSREIYNKMADNISKSERLRSQINKEIKAAAPSKDILIMALECISLMTGDQTFYNQNVEELIKR